MGQARVPAQEQGRVDVRSPFLIGEPGKATEHSFVSAKVVAKAASDAQIVVELVVVELGGETHSAPPFTGQGCAIDRNPSMSSRAYIIVDDRARCRNTSPTSSSDAPAFTSWVARL